jgi:protein-tyrosine phosphatase
MSRTSRKTKSKRVADDKIELYQRSRLSGTIWDSRSGKPISGRDSRMLPSSDSRNNPIRIDWIDPGHSGTAGKLGMTLCPGRKDIGRTARYDRNLKMDLSRIRSKHEVDVVVVLIQDFEFEELKIQPYFEVADELGLEVVWFPITDGFIPKSIRRTRALINHIIRDLRYGSNVLVHCKAGLGRAGTIVSCVLVGLGYTHDNAIALTRSTRKGAIENITQEKFVARFQEWESEWRLSEEV